VGCQGFGVEGQENKQGVSGAAAGAVSIPYRTGYPAKGRLFHLQDIRYLPTVYRYVLLPLRELRVAILHCACWRMMMYVARTAC